MSTVTIPCPFCRKGYTLPESMEGKRVCCAGCHKEFVVELPPPVLAAEGDEPADAAIRSPGTQVPPAPRPTPRARAVTGAKAPARTGMGLWLILLLILGPLAGLVLLFLVVIVGGFFWLWRSSDSAVREGGFPAVANELHMHEEGIPPIGPDVPEIRPPGEQPRPPRVGKPPVFAAAEPFEIKTCPIAGDREEKALPSAVRELTVGGGGRFVILSLPRENKIAVFDVNEAKVVKYLPLAEENAKLAAGMDRLIVCLPRANVIQRWNLRTLEREAAVPSPLPDTITEAVMGWASSGPLLIVASSRDGFGGGSGMFLDPATLKPVTYVGEGEQDPVRGIGTNLRASGDGTVFARPEQHSATSYVLRDGMIRTFRGDTSGFHATPGTDGSFICTPMGVYTEEFKPVVKPNNPGQLIISPFIPSWQGRFYMRMGDGSHDDRKVLTVYHHGTDHALAALNVSAGASGREMTYGEEAQRLSAEKRYIFLPDASVLIMLPTSNDRLILQKFDLDERLRASGFDYLLVTSRPPTRARKGEMVVYQMGVKSKNGGLKYKLEAGPKGMVIDAAGKLTWKVPVAGVDPENSVIVSVKDAAGKEVFHSFKLQLAE